MPIPNRQQNEDKDKFISRCMSSELMNKDYPDSAQRLAICYGQTKSTSDSILDKIDVSYILANSVWDDEYCEFIVDDTYVELYDEDEILIATEKNGKKVTLNKPFRTSDGPKKFSVYVKNDKGNVVKVNFGDPNMEIKRDDPARRRSYRARHNCDNPGPKWKANYWSCKMWSTTNVSDLT